MDGKSLRHPLRRLHKLRTPLGKKLPASDFEIGETLLYLPPQHKKLPKADLQMQKCIWPGKVPETGENYVATLQPDFKYDLAADLALLNKVSGTPWAPRRNTYNPSFATPGRSLRTCFLCLFVWCFFGPKTLFFRVRVLCQNNPFFGSVFLPKILGREGGGEEFWDALLLRGGLNLTCVAAWPKGPQRRKSRGKGRDPLGQKHAAGELGSLLVTIVGHLSSR